ncbi:MAG: O-antigen ligase family protein [Candidatus Moranbacteria bacterium]|nr:O-antigen ligase family protein [Candidatus Moranbacteria bacterium]
MLILRVFLFFLPFQFALSPREGIDLPAARVFAASIFIAWILLGIWKRSLRVQWSLQTALFLSFWFFLTLSVFVADESAWAWRKIFFLASFLPLYFIFLEKVSEYEHQSLALARSFVLGACLSAVTGVLQVVSQLLIPVEALFAWWTRALLPFFLGDTFAAVVAEYPSLLVNISGETVMRASAFFPDPHMHGFFLGLALPFAIFFALNDKTAFWKWGAGILCVADLLTFSRGAYLGLAFACVGVMAYLVFQKKGSVRKLFIGICFAITVFLIPNPVTERFWSSFSRQDGSVVARLELYQGAVFSIGERPWIGVGLGNYPLVVKPSAERRDPIYVHNLWLDLAVEIGIIGTAFLLLFVLRTLWIEYTRFRQGSEWLSLAVLGSLLIFFGHSLVETPIFSVQVLPVLLLVLALGNRSYDQK